MFLHPPRPRSFGVGLTNTLSERPSRMLPSPKNAHVDPCGSTGGRAFEQIAVAKTSSKTSPLIGSVFNLNGMIYRIDKEVGRGATKTVYLAVEVLNPDLSNARLEDRRHLEKVAVLICKLGQNTTLHDLKMEVEQIHRLQSRGGVKLIQGLSQLDGSDKVLGFVTEFCEGGTLLRWSKGKELETRVQMLIDLTTIVKNLHDGEIVLRDIKPVNICIKKLLVKDHEGNEQLRDMPVLIDLGTVSKLSEVDRTNLSGTPSYMPPLRSVLQPGQYTPMKHDVYSLGVTICEVLGQKVIDNSLFKHMTSDRNQSPADIKEYLFSLKSEHLSSYIDKLPESCNSIKEFLKTVVTDRFDLIPDLKIILMKLEEFKASLQESPHRTTRSDAATPTNSRGATPLGDFPDLDLSRILNFRPLQTRELQTPPPFANSAVEEPDPTDDEEDGSGPPEVLHTIQNFGPRRVLNSDALETDEFWID